MQISMMWSLFFFLSCNKSNSPETERTPAHASTLMPSAFVEKSTSVPSEKISPLSSPVSSTTTTTDMNPAGEYPTRTRSIVNTTGGIGSVLFSIITSKNTPLTTSGSDPKSQLSQLDKRDDLINIQSNITLSYIGMHLDNFRFSDALDDFPSLEQIYTQQDMTNWKTDFSTVLQGLSWSPYISPRPLMLDFLAGKKISYLQNGSFPIALRPAISQADWSATLDPSEKTAIQDFFTSEFIPRCIPGASVTAWQDFYGKQSLSRSTQTIPRIQPIYSILEPLTDPLGKTLPAIHLTDGTYQSIGFTIGMAWENERSQAFCRSFVIMGTYSDGTGSLPFAIESYSPIYGQVTLPTTGIQVAPGTSQYAYLQLDPTKWFSQVDWSNIEITMNGGKPLFAIFSEFSNSTEFYKIKNAISTSLSYTGISSPTNLFEPTDPAYTGTDISPTSRDFLTGYHQTSADVYTTANSLGISFLDATGAATGSLWVDYRNQNALMYSNQRVSRFWLKKTTDGKGGANLLMRPDRWSPPLSLIQDGNGNLAFAASAGTGQTLVRVGLHMEVTGSTGYLENLDTGAFLQPYDPITTESFPFISAVTPSIKVITKSTTLQPVQFSYTATPALMKITGITVDLASGFGLPGVGCSNIFSLYLAYQNCKNNTSASLPNPSSCPDALYSCPSPTPWALFSVKNATAKPIFFSMAPLGSTTFATDIFLDGKFTTGGYPESVLIQPNATWSGNTTIAGYPFTDDPTNSVQFFVNDVPTRFYFTTGFKGTSPTLTISLDASSNLTMTSSSTLLLKTLPAATAQ